MSLRTRLSGFWNNPDRNSSILANVLSIAGVATALWLWVDSKFESEFAKRLEPYEYLQEALSLMQSGQYDSSIEPFDKALDGLLEQNITESRLIAIAAPYMEALANVTYSHKHAHKFKELKKLVDEKLPDNGDIKRDIGWVYLEIGRPTEAAKLFRESITVFLAEDNESQAADSVWGIALSALALGETQEAVKLYELAYQLNSYQYNPRDTVNYPITSAGSYGEKYLRMYPKFGDSFSEFTLTIKESYEVEVDKYIFDGKANFDLLN